MLARARNLLAPSPSWLHFTLDATKRGLRRLQAVTPCPMIMILSNNVLAVLIS